MTYQKQSVSLASARAGVAAAFDAAGADDKPTAVAVVDENGDPVYMARMDSTPAADVRLAMRKAYTAAFIGRDTRAYLAQITEDGRTLADWADPMMTTLLAASRSRLAAALLAASGSAATAASATKRWRAPAWERCCSRAEALGSVLLAGRPQRR
jgi:uncharacterized protein GlcG (DUF336 family)